VLSLLSLAIMPVLAYAKQRTGREMGSKALEADAKETWVCAWLSFALLTGVGLNAAFGWWWADAAGALAMLPVILWQGGRHWAKPVNTRTPTELGPPSTPGLHRSASERTRPFPLGHHHAAVHPRIERVDSAVVVDRPRRIETALA
jgi:hypothetical protein